MVGEDSLIYSTAQILCVGGSHFFNICQQLEFALGKRFPDKPTTENNIDLYNSKLKAV